MLTHLRLRNFKAWRDTGEIRLAPLTVFFGTNSSGKTSIHQLLLMLKQTVESPDRRRVLHLGDRHTVVDLGTYQDMVHGHSLSGPVSFEMEWRLKQPLKIEDPECEKKYRGREIRFEAEIRRESRKSGKMFVQGMRYTLFDEDQDVLVAGMERREGGKYVLEVENYELMRRPGRLWPLPPPIRFHGFPDEATAYYKNSDFVNDLNLELQSLFDSLYYLGPLRSYPQRSYIWSGEEPQHVGWQGERAVEALLAAHGRQISPGGRKKSRPFDEIAARWLKEMGLIKTFRVEPIARGRKEYEVLVRTGENRHEVNLTDVGFGLSQVLPVIVQCFYVPAHSTIIFEQPEIHLHPRVQASLADLFIEAIRAREKEGAGLGDRRVQLLVESHSEHFLRRLQRRVAEEEVTPEEVAIYFCEPHPEGCVLHHLEVDAYGNIVNWPQDFFGDEMGDLMAMTEAASRRQMAEREG